LDKRACAGRLSEFIKRGWHVLEPSRPYRHGWHIDCVSDHLEAVTAGHISRLLVNVPPGTMKSMACGVFFPAWEWGPKALPQMRFMGTSYKDSLAIRDNVKTRRLILSDWYQKRWGDGFAMIGDQNTKTKFENDKTGFREAMAFNSMTGSRGDRVLLDDPLSVQMAKSDAERETANETFKEALPTRLNDPDASAIIVIMQRLHEDDVSGTIMANDYGYEHVMLPMEYEPERRCYSVVKPSYFDTEPVEGRYDRKKHTWRFDDPANADDPEAAKEETRTVYAQDPREEDGELLFVERFPRHVVERDKKVMGSYASAGQFQQRPAPREGGMFKRSWFDGQFVRQAPKGTIWVRHWDLAGTRGGTGARTAGVKLGRDPEGRYYVGHVVTLREEGKSVRKTIKAQAALDGKAVHISLPQDPGQAGKSQVQDYVADLAGYKVHAEGETGDKITRAEPFSAQCEYGNVFIVEGDWNELYLDELCIFPSGKLMDQVDASSGAFTRLLNIKGAMVISDDVLRRAAQPGPR
jgi:predicted phage terminase large subunit-like protein